MITFVPCGRKGAQSGRARGGEKKESVKKESGGSRVQTRLASVWPKDSRSSKSSLAARQSARASGGRPNGQSAKRTSGQTTAGAGRDWARADSISEQVVIINQSVRASCMANIITLARHLSPVASTAADLGRPTCALLQAEWRPLKGRLWRGRVTCAQRLKRPTLARLWAQLRASQAHNERASGATAKCLQIPPILLACLPINNIARR